MGSLATGETSMLPSSYVVEKCLINGPFGCVKSIFTAHPLGHRWLVPCQLIFSSNYRIFWLGIITNYSLIKYILGCPYLWLSFNVKSKAILKIIIPLIVCKWITMHKPKGVSIRIGKDWYTAVINLPDKHINTRLGMELVGFSRTTPK